MNLGAHIAVAARIHPEKPLTWLGSALPDVGAIGRFRLLGTTDNDEIRVGIALHHQTDEVFHSSSWFRSLQSELTMRLSDHGLPRGASKAIAHVGPELLLDGALLNQTTLVHDLDQAFSLIAAHNEQLLTLVTTKEVEWKNHLDKVQSRSTPSDYHDPTAVAYRLHGILARRPRLAFDARYQAVVAEDLALVWPTISDTAVEFIGHIADCLVDRSL